MTYATKAKTQLFSKKKLNLIKKTNDLAKLCYVDVVLVIRRNEQYYTYLSIDHLR